MCFCIVGFILNLNIVYYSFIQPSIRYIQYVAIIYVDLLPPTDVSAIVLSSHRIQITWLSSTSDNITGYLISYTTTASYTGGGNLTVDGGRATIGTLNNLEEGTLYTITVEATTGDNRMSANSNEVSVRTYTDGK